MNLQRFWVALGLFVFATTLWAQTSDDCATLQEEKGYPSYYCDCKEGYTDFVLPIDTIVNGESIWYKGWVSDLYDGLSAYLHSDCDLNFEIYTSCMAKTPKYTALFAQNKASAIDGEAIKRKLEENQVEGLDMAFYISISPVAGNGGRLIMRKESEGIPSTCDDPLHIFPGMSLYTTQPNDVYVVDPNQLYDLTDIILEWEPNTNIPCQLQITQSTCDGPIIAQTILNPNDIYILPAKQVKQAKDNSQQLYFHVNHAANTAGMFHCLAPEYNEYYIDTLLCQGMGLAVHDTVLTEPTVYTIDTTYQYANVYLINYYDLSFYEPDIQYDTLAFKYTQQPYLYRNQDTISAPGDYDLTIHTLGLCDERYMLHVYHDVDTIDHVSDTTICYGGIFIYNDKDDEKIYTQNVTFVQSYWKNQDTLVLDTLNVYFATLPEIVKDTVKIGEKHYGKTFSQAGDYAFLYTNPQTFCKDSILLHVLGGSSDGVEYKYIYYDVTLCEGKTYNHWGTLYTSSTVIYDTIQVSDDCYEIEVTTITFTEPEEVYESIYIEQSQLPYTYRGQMIDNFGEYEFLLPNAEGCLEIIHLSVIQKDIPASLDNPSVSNRPRLILRDGVVYILRGSGKYTLLGQSMYFKEP